MNDFLGYDGTRCVLVGAATGMGEACARRLVDLGAEVIGLDIAPITAPVKQSIRVDLSDPASIDAAVEQIPGEVAKLFVTAAVPGAPRFDALQTMVVNYVGVKHIIEKLIPRMPRGGAIALISSIAGIGYKKVLEGFAPLMEIEDFEKARQWCADNPELGNGYLGSKQALNIYTQRRASSLVQNEIRLNALLPCPTDTPIIGDFQTAAGGAENMDKFFQAPIGRNAKPDEMGDPLILLNSDAARFISGHLLIVDWGYCGEVDVGIRQGLL